MISVTQTLQDWNKLQQAIQALNFGWQAKDLLPVSVQVNRQIYGIDALSARLETAISATGWLVQPSQLHILPVSLAQLMLQPVLQGEGVNDDGTHWQVHHLGQDRWSWTEIQLSFLADDQADQATHLAEAVTFLAEDKTRGKLAYQRLWGKPTPTQQKLVIELAVFTGFEGVTA
ncbi:hypothetical protein RA178_09460 [Shewanella oncorhynchi]|uniref:Uncharacterized protein n=1 Tax=Shewanella oncorhynchi TaxID=2726434 RepID=A0AA50Q4P5_9GAMM|nr:hypothetical protein [Shewanella oncorhynchi]WMB74799.1 hypothetical protein RA178_09460 [Shewanella oncorhynchi]